MQFIEYRTESDRTEWLSEYRILVNVLPVCLHALVASWELWPLPSITREYVPHIMSPGKVQK